MTAQTKPICASCTHLSIVPVLVKGRPGVSEKMICAFHRPGVGTVTRCPIYLREPGADDE